MECQRCGRVTEVLNPLPETGEFVCDACYGEASQGVRQPARSLLARPSVRLVAIAVVIVSLWIVWRFVEPIREDEPWRPELTPVTAEPAPAAPKPAPAPKEEPPEKKAPPVVVPVPEPAPPEPVGPAPAQPVAPQEKPAVLPIEEPEEPAKPSPFTEDTDAGRIAYATIIYPSPAEAEGLVPPAVFSHRSHTLHGLGDCTACHNGEVFRKALALSAKPMTMAAIFAGRFCGACHNGRTDHPKKQAEKIFAADRENETICKRCHAVIAKAR